jgi:diaminopimelate epimerase
MNLHFYKYQGTGNDFILLDNRQHHYSGLTAEQVAFLCNRRFGIGADGLMLLQARPGYDFEMVYFNSDGQPSSMCGNGGRCMAAFAKKMGMIDRQAHFLAIDGAHDVILSNKEIALQMRDVEHIESIGDAVFLNTGSPHYVLIRQNVRSIDVEKEGKNIRYNERFKQDGTNVNFLEVEHNALFGRTYERGVEAETLSCGTGVTAMALAAAHLGLVKGDRANILTPGGQLSISFKKTGNSFKQVWLHGPATFVFEGDISI